MIKSSIKSLLNKFILPALIALSFPAQAALFCERLLLKDDLRRYVTFIEYGVEHQQLKVDDLERILSSTVPVNPLANATRLSKNSALKSSLAATVARLKAEDWQYALKAVREIHRRVSGKKADVDKAKKETKALFDPQMVWTSGEIDGNPQGALVHWHTLPDGREVLIDIDKNGREIKLIDPFGNIPLERITIYKNAAHDQPTGGVKTLSRKNGDFLTLVGSQSQFKFFIHSLLKRSTLTVSLTDALNEFYLHETLDQRAFLVVRTGHWFSIHEILEGGVKFRATINCVPDHVYFKVYNDENGDLAVFLRDDETGHLRIYHPLKQEKPVFSWDEFPRYERPSLLWRVSETGRFMFVAFKEQSRLIKGIYLYTSAMKTPEFHEVFINQARDPSLAYYNFGAFHITKDQRILFAMRGALHQGEKEKTLLFEPGSDDNSPRVLSDFTPTYMQFINLQGEDRLVVTHDDLTNDLLDLETGQPLYGNFARGRPSIFHDVALSNEGEAVFAEVSNGQFVATNFSSGENLSAGPVIRNLQLGQWFRRKNGDLMVAGTANHHFKEVISVYRVGKSKAND